MTEEELSQFFLSIFLKQFKNYEKRREIAIKPLLCLTEEEEEEELSQEWVKLE